MKKIIMGLLLYSVLMFGSIITVYAETPTPFPTNWIETPQVYPDKLDCPQGNPQGWGSVTPDPFWNMLCSQCIDPLPTSVNEYCDPQTLLDRDGFPCEVLTPTPTPYRTPTFIPTSTGSRYLSELTLSWALLHTPYKHFHVQTGSCWLINNNRAAQCQGNFEVHSSNPTLFPLNGEELTISVKARILPNTNGCVNLYSSGGWWKPPRIIFQGFASAEACAENYITYTGSNWNNLNWTIGRKTTMENVAEILMRPAPNSTSEMIGNFSFLFGVDQIDPIPPTPIPSVTPDYSSYCSQVVSGTPVVQEPFIDWGSISCTNITNEVQIDVFGWGGTIPKITICWQEVSLRDIVVLGVTVNMMVTLYGLMGVALIMWIFRT